MKKKAALVLSGGVSLGLAHLGVVKVLQDAEYEFDAIYGVSAGSIVGAGIAAGMNTDEIYDAYINADFVGFGKDVSKMNTGLLRGERIRNYFNEVFENKTIDQLQVRFVAGATDFDRGEFITIEKGLVGDALRCSSGLPMIFEPFFHPEYNKYLADGGLTQNLPLKQAVVEYKGDTIIAVNVHSLDPLPKDFHKKKLWGLKKDVVKYLLHSFNIMMNSQWIDITDPRVQLIEPDLSQFNFLAIREKTMKEIIEKGEKSALEHLAKLEN